MKNKKRLQKKVPERYQNFSEKEKKRQYGCKRYADTSVDCNMSYFILSIGKYF